MNKIKPFKTQKLGIKFNDRQVVQSKYKTKTPLSRDKIVKLVQQSSDELAAAKFNGQIMVSLKYNIGWRSGYFEDVGQPVALYEFGDSEMPEGQDTFTEFQVYTIKN